MFMANDRMPMTNCVEFCGNSSSKPSVNHFMNLGNNLSDHADHVSLSREDQQEKKEIDSSLSAAFNGLSFVEREELQENLHGVDEDIEEDVSFIENALRDLDEHLLHTKSGTVLETAEKMNPDYVSNLRQQFLRSSRYDVKLAADRMSLFFENKQRLFGRDKLVKDITLADFNEDDFACLQTGFLQITGRDRSNRLVIVHMTGLRAFKTLENELRARFYLMMQALKSDETRIRGAVVVAYVIGDLKDNMKGVGYLDHMLLMKSVPIHVVGLHVCCSDPRDYIVASMAIKATPAKWRARCRIHCSRSHLETRYYLATYGISPSLLPLTPITNKISLEKHQKWIQSCLLADIGACGPTTGAPVEIIQPNSNDVLYLGWKKSKNMGNNRLRALVSEMSQKYDSGTKHTKRVVVDWIIGEIQRTGGRFLNQVDGNEDTWEMAPMSDIRKSITQMFRNHRRRQSDAAQNSLSRPTMTIEELLPDDVAFGTRAKRNQGTELLYQLISERSEEYEALGRNVKSTIADAVVQRLKSEGGRFLQLTPDKTGWIEISDNEARARVSKYFRNHRRGTTKRS